MKSFCKDGIYNKMKKTHISPSFAMLIASLALTVISVAARIFLTLTALETKHGVYERGNILPTVYHIVLFFAIAAIVVFAIVKTPKGDPEFVFVQSAPHTFTACVCAFLLIAEVCLTLYHALSSTIKLTNFDILEICFAIPAAIYFLGLAVTKQKRSAVLMLTSFFPIAWCAVCLIRIYFDTSVLQVSPNKIFGELALLSAMIYFLSESRAQIGTLNHKLFIACSAAAPVLLFTSAIPNLFYPSILSSGTSDNFLRYAIDAAFALFIWSRLAAYVKANVPDKETESNVSGK